MLGSYSLLDQGPVGLDLLPNMPVSSALSTHDVSGELICSRMQSHLQRTHVSIGFDCMQPLVSFHGARQQETDHDSTARGIVLGHCCLLYENIMEDSFV